MTTSSDARTTPVTVIGLGAMGAALAGTFLDHGHPTTVWNRSPGKADHLVARGAARADSVAGAVASSPLVVVCLLDHKAVLKVLDLIGDAISGRVLVDLTSGSPDQARATAGWAAGKGADFLDGGIMADPGDMGTDRTFLLYSGSQRAFNTHEATLRTLGGTTYFGADPGLASLYFGALVGLGYEIWIAYLHTFALMGAEHVEAAAFARLTSEPLTGTVEMLPAMARAVDNGHYPPDAGPISTHAALIGDLIDTREARGIDTDRLSQVKALLDRRIAEGHGADGFTSLIEAIRKPA